MILYGFVVFLHITACVVLILVILFQAGRGGGLAEPFGGSSTKTIFGTKTGTFLTRATSVCAVLYIITCLTLGVLTARKSRSLVDKEMSRPLPQIPTFPSEIPLGEKARDAGAAGVTADSLDAAQPGGVEGSGPERPAGE
ncbi:preprotein translocase subunit SecG [Candidatus Omnitrophota bacterium]